MDDDLYLVATYSVGHMYAAQYLISITSIAKIMLLTAHPMRHPTMVPHHFHLQWSTIHESERCHHTNPLQRTS